MSTEPTARPPSTFRAGLRRLLSLTANPISALGLLLVGVALMLMVTFGVFALLARDENPYFDIVGYMILPGVLVTGLMIVPLGVLWKRRRMRRAAGPLPRYVHLDLSDPGTRGAVGVFLGVSFLLVLPALVVSAYEGYNYTESTEFCAKVCHTVMEPQGTAHAGSPHARVTCAECHIGSGAGWFVKSKLSGTRQVLAVWQDSFSRPIPPAITELRPARETCEECHWPEKFFGSQLKSVVHYAPDEANTRRMVRMLLRTGGADESIGRVEGIHMHMITDGRVEYVARDEHLQDIPWVRYVRADGRATVYRSDGLPHDAPPPAGIVRKVDCMDCHNRGAHHFASPQAAVDLQLESGRIDPALPYIKRVAVAALVGNYADRAAAAAGIEEALVSFYRERYPDVWAERAADVRTAVERVQEVYARGFFPEMRVTWQTYPENIGHTTSAGCFRCHDGRHVDAAGQAITSDCTVCHTFLNPIAERPGEYREGKFEHSMDLSFHEKLRCEQCHTGGVLLRCRECHDAMQGLGEWYDEGRLRRERQERDEPPSW